MVPCILRTHTIWDVANMRPVNGLQLLMAQGFPADVRLHFDETCVCDMDLYQAGCLTKFVEGTGKTRVDDMEIRSMAGNTMTVQVMGIIQAGVKRCQEVKHISQEVAMNKVVTLSSWHNVFHANPAWIMLAPSSRIQLSSSSQHSLSIMIMAECIPIQSSLDYDGATQQNPTQFSFLASVSDARSNCLDPAGDCRIWLQLLR